MGLNRQQATRFFYWMDTNRDGLVSLPEFLAAYTTIAATTGTLFQVAYPWAWVCWRPWQYGWYWQSGWHRRPGVWPEYASGPHHVVKHVGPVKRVGSVKHFHPVAEPVKHAYSVAKPVKQARFGRQAGRNMLIRSPSHTSPRIPATRKATLTRDIIDSPFDKVQREKVSICLLADSRCLDRTVQDRGWWQCGPVRTHFEEAAFLRREFGRSSPSLKSSELALGRIPLAFLELLRIELISTLGAKPMATFITTIKFTEKGLQGIRETGKRATAFKVAAKKMGVKVTGIYWTLADSMAS